jgi:hypothetical protein
MEDYNKVLIAFNKGFDIDKKGIVIGISKKIIKGVFVKGYVYISMRLEDRYLRVGAHRLQTYKKFGDSMFKPGIVVRHLDGNPGNNSWDNIEIGTHSDNMQDIPKHIRVQKAEHATSFVRKHDKQAVKDYYTECLSYKKTMEKFNISSKGTLHFILK